jgi:hypothetical protein
MFERECRLYAFVLDYARKLVADIDESDLSVQPAPGMNTPRWILGHLCMAADSAAQLLGQPAACLPAWVKGFGPGSDPANPPTPTPSKAELLAFLESAHARVSAAVATVKEERLAERHNFAPLQQVLPHVGDLLLVLMTTHPMMHLGQLSAWRRLRGLPAVLGI